MDTCVRCKHSIFNGYRVKNGKFRSVYRCELEPDIECYSETPACHFFQFKEEYPFEGLPPFEELPF